MSSLPLGAFELLSPLGAGGMGAVFRGVHRASGLPVAIKVLTVDRARGEAYRAAFREEVRAVAGLDHPGIVRVFDLGEIPEAVGDASDELVAGSPWLAMELGPLGTLADVRGPFAWGRCRSILLSLLDALAHAHARGIVHRDLKPANLLLAGEGEWNGRVRLLDFGLADAGLRDDPGKTDDQIAGTPQYMAPEQFRGHWRDYGPWTDLYALGCIAFELVTGQLAFQADSVFALAFAHALGERPVVPEGAAVPPGFQLWMDRLVAVEPGERFRCAADAARALSALQGEDEGGPPTLHALDPAELYADTIDADPDDMPTLAASPPLLPDRAASAATQAEDELPPMPADWRRGEAPRTESRLTDAGLGLYGLRAVPLVGREATRDLLWEALRDVRATGRPRLIVLHGPAGTGKSTLASWLGERSEELGVARSLVARHSRVPTGRDGAAAMFEVSLNCAGLDRGGISERLTALHPDSGPWLGDAVARVLRPAEGEVVTAAERHGAMATLLGTLAGRRSAVVLLDDLPRSPDSLALVDRLLVAGDLPVLMLATARDEELAEDAVAAAALDALLRRKRSSRVDVPPLSPAEQAALVRELLGFDSGLAAQLAERTAGNPLFATQLVGDWVDRGLLRPGPAGFEVQPGADLQLPARLGEVWAARLEALIGDLGPSASELLELAAAIGQEVDDGEWQVAAGAAGLTAALLAPLRERLLRSKLAVPRPGGWGFAHAMLRESLCTTSSRTERWARWNRAAAAAVQGRDAASLERLGRYRVAAGDALDGAACLLEAAEAWQALGVARRALSVLQTREQTLATAALPHDDERWGAGWVLRARVHRFLAELDDSLRWARRAQRAAEEGSWARVGALASLRAAQVVHLRGDFERSATLHRRALDDCDAAGLAQPAAEARQALADVSLRAGRFDEAHQGFADAAARFAAVGDVGAQGNCVRGLALVAKRREGAEAAAAHIREALALYRSIGHRSGEADCLNSLAEIARSAGRLEEAEDGYRTALAIQDAVGAAAAGIFPRINLGLVLLARGQWAEAELQLERCRLPLEDAGREAVLGCVWAFLALPSAGLGRWAESDVRLEEARRRLDFTGTSDADVAWALGRLGDLAEQTGDPERARRALALARTQWLAIGRSDEADTLERRLALLV